jgi:hypothetical protein
MTKSELELRVQELEKELQEAKTYKQYKRKAEELTQQTYDSNKTIKKLREESREHQEKFSKIEFSYNKLAKLFDEYIKSYEDSIETQKLFLRSNLRSQELMNSKIEKFNGSKEGGTE